jgi:hypothetical protein
MSAKTLTSCCALVLCLGAVASSRERTPELSQGAAKKIMMGSWHSDKQASISVTSIQSGEVVYAYSASTKNSAHGQQTTAEACGKHLREAIEQKK